MKIKNDVYDKETEKNVKNLVRKYTEKSENQLRLGLELLFDLLYAASEDSKMSEWAIDEYSEKLKNHCKLLKFMEETINA